MLLIKCGTQRAVLIVTGFGVSDIRTIVEKSALLEMSAVTDQAWHLHSLLILSLLQYIGHLRNKPAVYLEASNNIMIVNISKSNYSLVV